MAIREVNVNNNRYTEEFREEAGRQVVERVHSVAAVASRLVVTTHSLYGWGRNTALTLLNIKSWLRYGNSRKRVNATRNSATY
jgi:transposase-like protein